MNLSVMMENLETNLYQN